MQSERKALAGVLSNSDFRDQTLKLKRKDTELRSMMRNAADESQPESPIVQKAIEVMQINLNRASILDDKIIEDSSKED